MPDHGAALLEQPGVENSAQAKTNPSQDKHGKRSHKKQQVRRATPPSLGCDVPPYLGLTLALSRAPCTMKPAC